MSLYECGVYLLDTARAGGKVSKYHLYLSIAKMQIQHSLKPYININIFVSFDLIGFWDAFKVVLLFGSYFVAVSICDCSYIAKIRPDNAVVCWLDSDKKVFIIW